LDGDGRHGDGKHGDGKHGDGKHGDGSLEALRAREIVAGLDIW
jgi:hypothetical protein